MRPKADRELAWERLANDLDRGKLAEITNEIGLGEVIEAARNIVEGRIRGRIAVKVG
jgi:acrylyl-CoA reductase (NADPH)